MPVVNKRTDAFDVYIGRGSPWGNPFVLSPQGEHKRIKTLGLNVLTSLAPSRQQAIALYRELLWRCIEQETVTLEELSLLDGRTLGCYCAPKPCHGDVLLAAARWAKQQLFDQHEVLEANWQAHRREPDAYSRALQNQTIKRLGEIEEALGIE